MDTAEGTSPPIYDGFISYSHTADGLLAPRLQSALQRFAKPWWKRRAVRIFRDESSLSANPHLWSSITEALDTSGWFVLLLSPDAAQSEWVNQEIAYWVENRGPSRILPVVTDGTFGWVEGDVTGYAVPDALRNVFSEEPRWVDMRFAKDEGRLDLNNPTFSAVVADVASAIRGVPKDELESEEVRQHRRTVRTAWAAGGLVAALAIAAGGFAIQSARNAEEAEHQAALAEQSAVRAQESAEAEAMARQDADDNAALAEQEASGARTAEALARSRELAAAAVSQQIEDPELSILLALESIKATPGGSQASPAGVIALRQAINDNRLVRRLAVPEGLLSVRLSGDGQTAYYATVTDSYVAAVDVSSGSELWRYANPETVDRFTRIDLSPDGTMLAVSIEELASPNDPLVAVDAEGHDGKPTRVIVLDTTDGSVVSEIHPGPCEVGHSSGFSPDGLYLSVSAGGSACRTDPDDSWVALHDTSTWEEADRLYLDQGKVEEVTFSDDMSRALIQETYDVGRRGADLISLPGRSKVRTIEGAGLTAISPDGTRAVAMVETGRVDLRPLLVDLESGSRIAFLDAVDGFLIPDIDRPFSFSPDGTRVFVATRTHDYLFDSFDGQLAFRVGARTTTTSHAFSADGSMLVTASADGAILVFDLTTGPAAEAVGLDFPANDAAWINPNQVVEGPQLAITVLSLDRPPVLDVATGVLDPESGHVVTAYPGEGVQLDDGRFVMLPSIPIEDDAAPDYLLGPLTVWEPATDQTGQLTSCSVPDLSFDTRTPPACDEGEYLWGPSLLNTPGLASSRNGSVIAAQAFVPEGEPRPVRVWDGATLEVITEFTVPWDYQLVEAGSDWLAFRWWQREELAIYGLDGSVRSTQGELDWGVQGISSLDDSLLYSLGVSGRVDVLDTSSGELVTSWSAHAASLRGAAFSPDGTRLATTGEDDFVNIWDVSGIRDLADGVPPPLLDRFPVPWPSDAAWLDEETILVFLADGARRLEVSLNVEDLVAGALDRLTRGFELDECAIYQIDDCPTTVEAVRDG